MRERELWEQQASFFRRASMEAALWEPLPQKPSTAAHAQHPVFASIEAPEIEVPEGRHIVAHRFNGGCIVQSFTAP